MLSRRTESCPLLAMRFLPTDFPLALHQANTASGTAHGYTVTAPRHCPHTEQFALPTKPSPLPPPLSSYHYVSLRSTSGGNSHRPNIRGSRCPLGDPSARVFGVSDAPRESEESQALEMSVSL